MRLSNALALVSFSVLLGQAAYALNPSEVQASCRFSLGTAGEKNLELVLGHHRYATLERLNGKCDAVANAITLGATEAVQKQSELTLDLDKLAKGDLKGVSVSATRSASEGSLRVRKIDVNAIAEAELVPRARALLTERQQIEKSMNDRLRAVGNDESKLTSSQREEQRKDYVKYHEVEVARLSILAAAKESSSESRCESPVTAKSGQANR